MGMLALGDCGMAADCERVSTRCGAVQALEEELSTKKKRKERKLHDISLIFQNKTQVLEGESECGNRNGKVKIMTYEI